MPRPDLNAMTQWITAAAIAHPTRLDLEVAARTGLGIRAARRALARLVKLQWLVREGSPRRPLHRPGLLRQVVKRYALAGLQEDAPWQADFAPHFDWPASVNRMVQHAFCELLNNAIDHSGGTAVTVSLRQTAGHAQLLVSDNGCGLFRNLQDHFAIESPPLAMLELSKGKLTSQPQRHSGQGLFFTAQLAEVFDLHANDASFQRRAWEGNGWCRQTALKHPGTSVYASFALDTRRTLEAVRMAASFDGTGIAFERTVVPLRLLTSAAVGLESRSQARRVGARLGDFARAELDFSGIGAIGHAFADELLRVLPAHTTMAELMPVNMSPAVEAMVRAVQGSATGRVTLPGTSLPASC